MAATTVVLEVSSDKATELVSALSKRDYINIVKLDRAEKKKRKLCPCCGAKFPRELVYTVTSEICEALLSVIHKMRVSKSVVLVNKSNPIGQLPEYERARCVEMPDRVIERAMALGLLQEFQDGSRLTHFVSEIGLLFLVNEESLSPSQLILLRGEVVESSGSIEFEDVKFKDRIRHDEYLRNAKRAVAELPKAVVEFVKNGQMSLV